MTIREINLTTGEVTEREYTAEELAVLPVVMPDTPATLLTRLDADNALTQRNLRESIMLMAEAIKTINPAVDLTLVPGVAKVFEIEAQAAALRAQL